MPFRIRALYADKPRIVLLVLLLLLIEIGVFTWLLTHGEGWQARITLRVGGFD